MASYLLCFSVAIICQMVAGQSYSSYYMEDYCGQNIDLMRYGASSIKLKGHRSNYKGPSVCEVHIKTSIPFKGIVAVVQRMNLRTNIFGDCRDYIEILYNNNKTLSRKICSKSGGVFVNDPPYASAMTVKLSVDKSGIFYGSADMEIILTQFGIGKCNSTEFKCKVEGRCIWKDFECDGEDNCGDDSDERDCRYTRVGAIVGGVISAIIIIGIIVGVLFCCRRRRSTITTTRIISPQPMMPQPVSLYPPHGGPNYQGAPPPPAYGSQGPGYPAGFSNPSYPNKF